MSPIIQRIGLADFLRMSEASQCGWILLVGSGVSRVATCSLPLAAEAANAIGSALAKAAELEAIRWSPTQNIANSVAIAARGLKFEVLVSRMLEHMGTVVIDGLTDMFSTHQVSEEHEAIAKLLISGKVTKVFTTNFDRGISRAIDSYGETHNKTLDERVTHLHGSVLQRDNIVATLDRLGNPSQEANVARWLASNGAPRLLIVGYSGQGDLDVLPAIRSLARDGTQIYWAEQETVDPPAVPGTTVVSHDLSNASTSILMRWSTTDGSQNRWLSTEQVVDEARERLLRHFNKVSLSHLVNASLAVLLEAREGSCAVALAHWAQGSISEIVLDPHTWGVIYERASAYHTAALHLRRASEMELAVEHHVTAANLLAGCGFVLAQAGAAREAKLCYRSARALLPGLSCEQGYLPVAILDNVIRGELELELSRTCGSLQHASSLLQLMKELEEVVKHPNATPLHRTLAKLCKAEFAAVSRNWRDGLTGCHEVINEFKAIEHYEGWARSARLLASLDKDAGRHELKAINRGIRRSGQARRDLLKNQIAYALTFLPFLPQRYVRRPPWNMLWRRTRVMAAERRARRIENVYRRKE